MDKLKKDAKIGTFYEEKADGKIVRHQREHLSNMEKTGKAAVELQGMSLEKRCKQLFDPAHKSRLERKVLMAMELERREKKDFSKLSV